MQKGDFPYIFKGLNCSYKLHLKTLHPALRPMFPMATYTSREPMKTMDVVTEESNFRHTNYPQSLGRLKL